MEKKNQSLIVADETIMSKIYLIREQKVMLDSDLAELYDVETKRLKEQVKRNAERFPEDFMFELTKEEYFSLRSHFATLKRGQHSKYLPFAFTEHGVLMLSNVLKSKRAIKVSIQIIRIFTKLRKMLLTHKNILLKLEKIEKTLAEHDNNIFTIFEYMKQFEQVKQEHLKQKNRKRIGYEI